MNDLDKIKDIWKEVSNHEVESQKIDIDAIKKMATVKSFDIVQRIRRNLLIAFAIVIVLITVDVCLNTIAINTTDIDLSEFEDFTKACNCIGIVTKAATILLFAFMTVKINKIIRQQNYASNVKERVGRTLQLLRFFKKAIIVILIWMLLFFMLVFAVGFDEGIHISSAETGRSVESLFKSPLFITLSIITFSLLSIILYGVYLFLMKVVFRRMFGNYMKRMETIYQELSQ